MDAATTETQATTPRKVVTLSVCRLCGDDLKFGQKKQVFNLLLQPALKTSLDALAALPVAEEDAPQSVCGSCFQLLNKYSRTKENFEKITNSVKELCDRNPHRFKRCATGSTTPSHERKRRVGFTLLFCCCLCSVFCSYNSPC